jgi:hypothetical protein
MGGIKHKKFIMPLSYIHINLLKCYNFETGKEIIFNSNVKNDSILTNSLYIICK